MLDPTYIYHETYMEMINPAHPGEVLREYLPEGMTVKEAAKRSLPC